MELVFIVKVGQETHAYFESEVPPQAEILAVMSYRSYLAMLGEAGKRGLPQG